MTEEQMRKPYSVPFWRRNGTVTLWFVFLFVGVLAFSTMYHSVYLPILPGVKHNVAKYAWRWEKLVISRSSLHFDQLFYNLGHQSEHQQFNSKSCAKDMLEEKHCLRELDLFSDRALMKPSKKQFLYLHFARIIDCFWIAKTAWFSDEMAQDLERINGRILCLLPATCIKLYLCARLQYLWQITENNKKTYYVGIIVSV